jgi:exodeoxyribonuclease V alpha subunit
MRDRGLLDANDLTIVDAVAGRFGEADPEVLLGLAFAVRAPRMGHVGVDLMRVHEQVDDGRGAGGTSSGPEVRDADFPAGPGQTSDDLDAPIDWPENPGAWQASVLASPMVGGPDEPDAPDRPFVGQRLADGRVLVMSRRMWREQERLADAALAMVIGRPRLDLPADRIESGIERLFGGTEGQGARAVATAARSRLTVVTGGPGTGKTYSIKRLLALLLEATDDLGSPLRIELAAPTGKAAVRMAQAISEDLEALDVEPGVRDALAGLRPRTLHKLLGVRPDGSCRHGSERPVPADLVVVDEASMVDLALMRRLFEAMPDGSRLVLLGDRDQLASVEAGTVLADFVAPVLEENSSADHPLSASVVHFSKNHRFAAAPTVAEVAAALQGRADDRASQVVRWMTGQEVVHEETVADRITYLGRPGDGRPTEAQLDALAAPYLRGSGFVGMLCGVISESGAKGARLRDPSFHLELLEALEGYRILAVHRRGPLGVAGIEGAMVKRCQEALEDALRKHRGLPESAPMNLPKALGHWLGRPVMVTENSYDVGLMNGDIGLVLPTRDRLAVVFPNAEHGLEATRVVSLARLPEHTGALAMTVHKSQGSQFRRVAMVLAGRDSPIQTRELVYTAITRTSERLDWLGDADELDAALRRRVGRASGLGDLLWSH